MTQDPSASPPEQPDQPEQVAQQSVPDQPASDQPAPDQPASDQPATGEPDQPAGGPLTATGGAAAPRRKLVLLVTVGALAAIAIVVVGVFVVARLISGGGEPEAGDCMNDAAVASDMRVVDCGAEEAVWSVLGVETGRTFGDFEATPLEELCQAHPGSVQALWVTDAGEVTDSTDGDVVCLEPLEPAPVGG